jgi:beta-hydroxylase
MSLLSVTAWEMGWMPLTMLPLDNHVAFWRRAFVVVPSLSNSSRFALRAVLRYDGACPYCGRVEAILLHAAAMFLAASDFEFTATLEAACEAIKREYESLPRELLVTWPEKELAAGEGWKVFGLYAFGQRLEANCQRCPVTSQLVASIEGLTTAGFSVLLPGTRIRPHRGYTSAVLRCHLGLITPAGCGLMVGGDTRTWQAGKCLVFDDTVEHSAWNLSTTERVVLLLDALKPGAELNPSASPEAAELAARVARQTSGDH